MRIPLLLLALTSFAPAVVPIALARPQEQSTAQTAQSKKEMVATVESVNAQEKTIKVQEMADPIVVTDSTVFDDDVQLSKLHAGTKVKIVGSTSADGKFQASEIRAVK